MVKAVLKAIIGGWEGTGLSALKVNIFCPITGANQIPKDPVILSYPFLADHK